MFLIHLYLAVLALAFLSSLPVYRLDRFHYKVISIILTVDLLSEITAYCLLNFYHRRTVPVYNVTMLLEYWLYAYYFRLILKDHKVRQGLTLYLALLPVVWLALVVFVFGINKWNSLFSATGGIFTILFAVLYYRQLFTADELVRLSTSFEFWVATALIIYYAGNFTYLGMLNLLTDHFRDLAAKLLDLLTLLNMIFYSIYIYAFICTTRIKR